MESLFSQNEVLSWDEVDEPMLLLEEVAKHYEPIHVPIIGQMPWKPCGQKDKLQTLENQTFDEVDCSGFENFVDVPAIVSATAGAVLSTELAPSLNLFLMRSIESICRNCLQEARVIYATECVCVAFLKSDLGVKGVDVPVLPNLPADVDAVKHNIEDEDFVLTVKRFCSLFVECVGKIRQKKRATIAAKCTTHQRKRQKKNEEGNQPAELLMLYSLFCS